MSILIASIFGYNSYSRGIMPDILQSQIDKNPGSTIYYLTDSYSFDISYFNIKKRPELSYLSKTGTENTLKLINGAYQHIKISDIVEKEDYAKAKAFFEGKESISIDQVFENFEVGEATLSTYFSCTRDRDLLHIKQPFVMELGINALALYLGTKRFLKQKEISEVYNFNGRQDYVRGIMRAALAANINCFNVERARMGGFIEFYKNILSHDIKARKEMAEKCWEQSSLSEKEKTEVASQFFIRQRNGASIISPTYLKKQQKGSFPKTILNGNENVVLFNSSDDEFAALGQEFKNPFFKDQNEGIRYLVELFGKKLSQINLIVRMHPNLSEVDYEYVDDLRNLHQKYPNIYVVYPESKTDSYALMEIASKIISFGSLLGLEANFYGKPVVLLGKSYYYFSNVAYVPKEKDDIFKLISKELQPLPKTDALKFGFYYLRGGTKTKYYYEKNMGEGIYFKGKRTYSYSLYERFLAKIVKNTYLLLGIRLKF